MSSEMRGVVKEMRAGTPCYVAKVGGGRCVNGAECLRCAERLDWADRLERTLLARTEAGADGADMIQWRYTNAETGEVLTPWTECDAAFREKRKDAPGYQFRELFAHPQDASGDAEPRFQPLDRVVWTSKLGTEFRGAIRHINEPQPLSYWIDLDDGTSVQRAIESDIAMQAKEAK